MYARRSLVPALLFALGCVPATASAAPYLQAEQLNRLSGAQGAYTAAPAYNDTFASFVTDDGRYATFTVPKSVFGDSGLFVPGEGLYVRDIVDNTTRKISGGLSYAAGLDLSGQKLSFVTTERLDAADTNGARDLYVWNGANGAITLLSRADGAQGAATGLASAGVLSANGKQAVWGAEDGVYRRDLATGRSVKISGGDFVGRPDDYPRFSLPAPADQFLSDDAKVVATTESIVTPTRTYPNPAPAGANSFRTNAVGPLISPAGDLAIWQGETSWDGTGENQPPSLTGPLEVLETGDGRRHTFAPTAKLHALGWINVLGGVGRDGRSVIINTYQDNGPSERIPNLRMATWAPESDTIKKLGRRGGISRNQKFAVVNTYEGVYEGPARVIVATPGNTLPGGTPDLPAANLFAYTGRTCEYGSGNWDQALVTGQPNWLNDSETDPLLPLVASVKLAVFDPAGRELGAKTWLNDGSYAYAEQLDWLDNKAFRLDTTVKFCDGRSVKASTDFPAEKVCDRPIYDEYRRQKAEADAAAEAEAKATEPPAIVEAAGRLAR